MHVLVLGAGVVGVTTAYYLSQQGYSVTLVERDLAVAQQASFANAGQLSWGYATPWAAPGIPLKAVRWLVQRDAPLALRLSTDWQQYRWLWQMLRNCTSARYAINKERMLRLATYSHACLDELRRRTGIAYEGRQQGLTQLFRTQQQLDDAAKDITLLQDSGVAYQLLSPAEIAQVEPALAAAQDQLSGGLHLPGDQTGDCYLFTQRLAQLAQEAGVEFRLGSTVQRLQREGDLISGVVIGDQLVRADHYVVALGCDSRALLLPVGIDLPVYPLKGYSLTYRVTNPAAAPQSTVLDETFKVAITRFDERVRVGGMAELVGYDVRLNPKRRQTLERVVNSLYPDAGVSREAEFWAGLRPSTPDSVPVVGPTAYQNLFLNTGHGTLGWTMACGSAQYLTDVIAKNSPEINGAGLAVFRYR